MMSRTGSAAPSHAVSEMSNPEVGRVGRVANSPLPIGSRLPPLVSRVDSGEFHWRDPSKGATVAVFLDSGDRDSDLEYLTSLADSAKEFGYWDGRLVVVGPGLGSGPEFSRGRDRAGSLSYVTEANGEVEGCGVHGGESALLIADRWGQVYYGARGPSVESLPAPTEISEWLQFMATQCPECGVPDRP